MSFSFNDTAGTSQSTIKPQLEGNKIHEVKLISCEKDDIQGVKDPTQVYKVIKITFENEDGQYQHTIFEPRPEDFERKENEYTDKKTGKVNKIPQPANVESMMLLFKHIMDSFVPEVASKIDSGEKSLNAPDWDTLRDLVLKILTVGKGRSSKIKLLKNKKGEAIFPGFFASVNREGKVYLRNNFIGDKVAFTAYELQRIQNEATATPTNMSNTNMNNTDKSNVDLDFDIDKL